MRSQYAGRCARGEDLAAAERIEVIQHAATHDQPQSPGVQTAEFDVTVIGGGLAGMAAAIHLSKAGLRVLCIEPDLADTDSIGESLDWSAPALLDALGLTMEQLIAEKIATYKRHVTLKLGDGCDRSYVPGEWLGRPPFNVELRTLHVDRSQLNRRLREIVVSQGVTFLPDRVVAVETDGRRVTAVSTQHGNRICSPWFIDASGSAASLFARAFHLPAYESGPRKVAIWSYFPITTPSEGTTLYADGVKPPYMEWVWEIPINPNTISVGYVATGETIKAQRQKGRTVEEILREKLGRFPRFESLLRVCSGHLAICHLFRLPHAWTGRRTELVDRRRSRRHGGSDDLKRGDRCAEACIRSVSTDYRVSPPEQDPLPGSGHV